MDTFESRRASGIGRRSLLLAATTTAVAASVVELAQAQPPTDPLASWSEGPAKKAILDFVRDTVDPSSKNFVPPQAHRNIVQRRDAPELFVKISGFEQIHAAAPRFASQ